MRLILPLLTVIVALTLPACRSPQVRYHTLLPPTAGAVSPPAPFAIEGITGRCTGAGGPTAGGDSHWSGRRHDP